MKVLIPILIGLLVVGCGKDKQSTNTNESSNTPEKSAKKKVEKETPSKVDDKNSTTAKPVKELTAEEKVVGTYEFKHDKDTYRLVFLDNGIAENYHNDGAKIVARWSVVDGEIHADHNGIVVFRINKDGSITVIATIHEDGKREKVPKDKQSTFKRIKSETKETPSKGDDKNSTTTRELTTEEKKVVGIYERKYYQNTIRIALLENGTGESIFNGVTKPMEDKWSLVGKELHLKNHGEGQGPWNVLGGTSVWRINPNGSISEIAVIFQDGERLDYVKISPASKRGKFLAFKKIK
jgi:hypothetical protein